MSKPPLWVPGDGPGPEEVENQLLYDEQVPANWTVNNPVTLPPNNVILADIWKAMVAGLPHNERFARWPASFTSKGLVQASDRGWGQPSTFWHEGKQHYSVLFASVQLAGDHHRKYGISRSFGHAAPSGRGGTVIKGDEVPLGPLTTFGENPATPSNKAAAVPKTPASKKSTTSGKKGPGRPAKRRSTRLKKQTPAAADDEVIEVSDDAQMMSGGVHTDDQYMLPGIAQAAEVKVVIPRHKQYGVQPSDEENELATTQPEPVATQPARKRREYGVQQSESSEEPPKRRRRYQLSDNDDELDQQPSQTSDWRLSRLQGSSITSGSLHIPAKDITPRPRLASSSGLSTPLAPLSAVTKHFSRSPHVRPVMQQPTSEFTTGVDTAARIQLKTDLAARDEEIKNLKATITNLEASAAKEAHDAEKQIRLTRDIARLLATSTAAVGTLSGMINYTVQEQQTSKHFRQTHDGVVSLFLADATSLKAHYHVDFSPDLAESADPWKKCKPSTDLQNFCQDGVLQQRIQTRSPTPEYRL